MVRYAKKVDSNQRDIVSALRKIPGVKVELDHDDILVGFRGKNYWFEIKNSEKVGKNGVTDSMLKDSQKKLIAEWTGHYSVVWTLDQILVEIGHFSL